MLLLSVQAGNCTIKLWLLKNRDPSQRILTTLLYHNYADDDMLADVVMGRKCGHLSYLSDKISNGSAIFTNKAQLL